jgi:hypothetical protein
VENSAKLGGSDIVILAFGIISEQAIDGIRND